MIGLNSELQTKIVNCEKISENLNVWQKGIPSTLRSFTRKGLVTPSRTLSPEGFTSLNPSLNILVLVKLELSVKNAFSSRASPPLSFSVRLPVRSCALFSRPVTICLLNSSRLQHSSLLALKLPWRATTSTLAEERGPNRMMFVRLFSSLSTIATLIAVPSSGSNLIIV